MTIEEWAKDFKSYVNELDIPRDDYKGIIEYIDDAIAMLKEQQEIVRCKDCSMGEEEMNYYGNPCICCHNPLNGVANVSHKPNWFCADGKRKS